MNPEDYAMYLKFLPGQVKGMKGFMNFDRTRGIFKLKDTLEWLSRINVDHGHYHRCDLKISKSNKYRYISYGQKEKKDEPWYIFLNSIFRDIYFRTKQNIVMLPDNNSPAYMYISNDMVMVDGGLICSYDDQPGIMNEMTNPDGIYDFKMDGGGMLQHGLDEFL